jgi:hypothetical protein
MLSEEAKRKLRLLNIGEYIEAVEMQEKDPTTMGMPFEDRFQMATDHVYQCKNNARVRIAAVQEDLEITDLLRSVSGSGRYIINGGCFLFSEDRHRIRVRIFRILPVPVRRLHIVLTAADQAIHLPKQRSRTVIIRCSIPFYAFGLLRAADKQKGKQQYAGRQKALLLFSPETGSFLSPR